MSETGNNSFPSGAGDPGVPGSSPHEDGENLQREHTGKPVVPLDLDGHEGEEFIPPAMPDDDDPGTPPVRRPEPAAGRPRFESPGPAVAAAEADKEKAKQGFLRKLGGRAIDSFMETGPPRALRDMRRDLLGVVPETVSYSLRDKDGNLEDTDGNPITPHTKIPKAGTKKQPDGFEAHRQRLLDQQAAEAAQAEEIRVARARERAEKDARGERQRTQRDSEQSRRRVAQALATDDPDAVGPDASVAEEQPAPAPRPQRAPREQVPIDPQYASLLEPGKLDELDHQIGEAIRQAKDLRLAPGEKELPDEEFRDLVRDVRNAVIARYVGSAPDTVAQAVLDALRSKRTPPARKPRK